MAEIVPIVDGQTLFTMVIVGSPGFVHTLGTVATAALIGLAVTPSKSQRQRVSTLWAGPVCAYVGKVDDHEPPFTRYWSVLPAGHGVPAGAVIVPPATVHAVLQVLLTMVTLLGAALNIGQVGQVFGAVVADAFVLTQLVVVFLQRANTVMTEIV